MEKEKKKLVAVIASGNDGFGVWLENVPGVYGAGSDIESAKQNLIEGIALYKEYNDTYPEVLDAEIEWVFELDSFLKVFEKVLPMSGLSDLSGVNPLQLSHYKNGKKKPRKDTLYKIENAIHQFGEELQSIKFTSAKKTG